jgi:endonuclease/exonuclease/phosphatase family metal-dependent hydrolase
MSYNVENLFDNVHDLNKEDWEFVPQKTPGKAEYCAKENSKRKKAECLESDWNEEKLNIKLGQILDVVKSARPNLPEFLGVVEIENKNVLNLLAKKLGYKNFEITDGPDKRGVNVALLYKENDKIMKLSINELSVPVEFPTRNILEVRFKINTTQFLTLFVNHWPSLHNPDSARVKAAEVLKQRIETILKLNPEENILCMGDFNTIDSNSPHPFTTVLLKDSFLTDIATAFKEDKSIADSIKKNFNTGTYYYPPKDEWNMLDHFFINKNLKDGKGLDILINSFEIYSKESMRHEIVKKIDSDKEKGIKVILAPKRYDHQTNLKEKAGYSDHFPILIDLHLSDAKK